MLMSCVVVCAFRGESHQVCHRSPDMFSNMRSFLPARAFPGAACFGKKSSLVDEPFWVCTRGATVLRNIQNFDRTKKKVTVRFGMEWVGGARPLEINALHNEVEQERKTGRVALEFSK